MRTENLAIVFTDIKGFTERTSRQTRAENERLLKLHEMLLVPAFRAFGGAVRKSIGDAYLVTFESPTNAVLCGAAIQDRLFTFNQSAPEPDRLEIRVAINIGEVRVEANDVFGEPVNVAARVEGIALANQVFFTEAVYLVMNKAEVPVEEVGSFELKGVPEKVRVFKIPRGPYRLTSGPLAAQSVPEPALPYGGIGLARAPNLPAPDVGSIDRALAARQTRRRVWAHVLSTARTAAKERPAVKWAGLGAGGALVLGLIGWIVSVAATPKVERLLRAGQIAEASSLVGAMPEGAERSYWGGRVHEQQQRWGDAVDDYVDAARASADFRRRALDRLDAVARAGDCSAKVRVARAVGEIGDRGGASILDRLEREKPQQESGLGGLIFGSTCDPRRAAEQASKKLESR